MSHSISLDDAKRMISDYKANREVILAEDYKGKDILAYSETFDVDAILTLIANTLCRKMRIYYGMDETKKVHAILVAADGDDKDILPIDPGIQTPMIVEDGVRCPTQCPTRSELNY
jgi:hypothetical protein